MENLGKSSKLNDLHNTGSQRRREGDDVNGSSKEATAGPEPGSTSREARDLSDILIQLAEENSRLPRAANCIIVYIKRVVVEEFPFVKLMR